MSKYDANCLCKIMCRVESAITTQIMILTQMHYLTIEDYGWYSDTGHEFEIDDSPLYDIDKIENTEDIEQKVIRINDTFNFTRTIPKEKRKILEIYDVSVDKIFEDTADTTNYEKDNYDDYE